MVTLIELALILRFVRTKTKRIAPGIIQIARIMNGDTLNMWVGGSSADSEQIARIGGISNGSLVILTGDIEIMVAITMTSIGRSFRISRCLLPELGEN